jgi:DNA-directed RNA polymerase specialized sigma24 family protein
MARKLGIYDQLRPTDYSQGRSQPEIARILQVSIGTVNIDVQYLREQAKENIRKYIDKKAARNEYV